MQFYDATNKRAICQEIDRLCDSDDTAYPRLDKTARANDALEDLVGKIILSDGTWQYDDTNYTTVPRGKGTLIEGQQQYSFATEYLTIVEIDVLDTSNMYQRMKQIDPQQLGGLSPEQYFGVDSSGNPVKAFPQYYDIEGDSIRLYPAPTSSACILTNGLRVTFKRTANLFTAVATTAADTTEPGLPSPFHVLIAYKAALPYCATYKKDRVPWLASQIAAGEANIIKFYAHRNQDYRAIMTPKRVDYI